MKKYRELTSQEQQALKDALKQGRLQVNCPWWLSGRWEDKTKMASQKLYGDCHYRIKPREVRGEPFGQNFLCDACREGVPSRVLYQDKDRNEMSLCQRCSIRYNTSLNALHVILWDTKFRPSL